MGVEQRFAKIDKRLDAITKIIRSLDGSLTQAAVQRASVDQCGNCRHERRDMPERRGKTTPKGDAIGERIDRNLAESWEMLRKAEQALRESARISRVGHRRKPLSGAKSAAARKRKS